MFGAKSAPAGVLLIGVGVWMWCQIWGGAALERLGL